MRDIMRMIATTIIWGAFISVVGVTLSMSTGPVSRMNGGEIVGMVAVLMIGVVSMTYAIWHNGFQRGQFDTDREYERRSKPKRTTSGYQNRVSRLIDSLDDDDIYELEALLLDRERDSRGDHVQQNR